MKLKNWNIGAYRLLVFLLLLSLGCSSKKNITTPNNSSYSEFIAQQKTQILANGNQLKFIDTSHANPTKTILLVHGVPTSSWMYRHLINGLVNKGYRVIAPDLLGYGQSDKPKGYDIYAPAKMGAYLLELMDSLAIDSWTHLCHDAGGLWTWEMLKLKNTRVNKLVLLNTIVFQEGFFPPMEMKKNFISKMYVKTYVSNLSRKGMMKATLSNGLHNKNLCVPEMIEGYIRPSEGRLDRALYQFFSNVCVKELQDYEPLLKSLKIPTKVIWGMEDEILKLTPQEAKLMSALNLKSSDILKLTDAKHFIAEEKPQEIINFLD